MVYLIEKRIVWDVTPNTRIMVSNESCGDEMIKNHNEGMNRTLCLFVNLSLTSGAL